VRLQFRSARSSSFVCFVALCLAATEAVASQVIITVTGTMSSGHDSSGVFGPTNGDLTGKNFTLVFTVDDTAGVKNTATCGGVPYFTSITSTTSSNPATATLTIGGGSFTFGVLNASYEANSEVAWYYASAPTCSADSQIYLAAGDGYYGNGSGLNGYVYPATGTILTSNSNWEAPFFDSNLYVSPVGAGSLQFEISEH